MHPAVVTTSLLLIASLMKLSEQGGATCNNVTLAQCSALQPTNMPGMVDLPAANAFCSNATAFASCISNMSCVSSDVFSTDGGYINAKASADQYSFVCSSSNLAVWVANSQCIATATPTTYQSCYNALGATNISMGQYCTFYQSLFQCIFNQASQQCNPASAQLILASYFFGVKASMALIGCTLTMPSTANCTSCGFQCPYGIQMDTLGCPVCSSGCINPCQNVPCQQSQACVPVCNLTSPGMPCTWTGMCIANTTQQCNMMAFSQCVEPSPYYPYTDPTGYCSVVNAYDRCLHSIGCNSNDTMYPMLMSRLWTSNGLKLQCAYVTQQGVATYAQNLMCASTAASSNASNACSTQITPPSNPNDQCGYYSQLFQCFYNVIKTACNADAAKVIVTQQLYVYQSMFANSSMSCMIATPWGSTCATCSTTCQYGYVADAIGCNDCNRCKDSPCQTKVCLSGQTCTASCTNSQCTATCSAISGGLSLVKNADAAWWKMVLCLLFSTVAAAMAWK